MNDGLDDGRVAFPRVCGRSARTGLARHRKRPRAASNGRTIREQALHARPRVEKPLRLHLLETEHAEDDVAFVEMLDEVVDELLLCKLVRRHGDEGR